MSWNRRCLHAPSERLAPRARSSGRVSLILTGAAALATYACGSDAGSDGAGPGAGSTEDGGSGSASPDGGSGSKGGTAPPGKGGSDAGPPPVACSGQWS